MKPTQAESHAAESRFYILDTILDFADKDEWFSDSKLIKLKELNCHPHTIRNARKEFLERGIIEVDTSQKLPNNEKAYRVVSITKAKELRNWYEKIDEKNWGKKHVGKYYKRFKTNVKETIELKYYDIKGPQNFPFAKYLRKICPVCKEKRLRKIKENSGPLDRRCNNCKITFQFGDNSLVYAFKK